MKRTSQMDSPRDSELAGGNPTSPRRTTRLVAGSVVAVSLVIVTLVGPGRVVDEAAEREARRQALFDERSQSRLPLPESTTSTTTVPPRLPVTPEVEAILAATEALAMEPTVESAIDIAQAMRAHGDLRWVPYLVDMSRFFGMESTFQALETITGERGPIDPPQAYQFYGSWLYDAGIDAGPEYTEWKAILYGRIDPDFTAFIAQVDDPVIAAEIQWGGVRRAGIPELNNQATISVAEAAVYMTDDELTFGASINGEHRAYPHRILDHHELANDELGGEPVALANCTLCRTGVLFSRIVDGAVLDFQTSGLLRNSNKVMVDVQTESLWNQLTGEAIAGPLRGTVLDRFPITVTLYGEWVAEHPDTTVVRIPIGGPYSYEPGDAYADYYGSDDLWFAAYSVPDVFPEKEVVATVDWNGGRLAVGVAALADEGPQLLDLAGGSLLAVPTSGGARFYDATAGLGGADVADVADLVREANAGEEALVIDGTALPRVQSGHSFWFAWYGNYPDTTWWPAT